MLNVGTRLGNYEILDLIGMGGMGSVYRARHSVLGRIDAVKVLAHHLTLQSNFKQRFLHEAKIQAKLRHPNIAEVYDCFSSGDQYCISMEYVDGLPLNRLLSVGVLGEDRLRKVFTQILDAMAFSHRQNVVHRDLKGSNLIITPHDEVKIVDFGIAKIIDDQADLTMAQDQLGTTRYMAPEQILNSAVTTATDVYALGILLYESVTGHVPFEMFSDYEIKKAHIETKADDPREKAPYVSDALAKLMMECLNKKQADRPQTAGIVQERFKEISPLYTDIPPVVADHPTSIRSEGSIFIPEDKPKAPVKKMRKYTVFAIVVGAICLIAGLIMIFKESKSGNPSKPLPGTWGSTNTAQAISHAAGDISSNSVTQAALSTGEEVREMAGESGLTNESGATTGGSNATAQTIQNAATTASPWDPNKLLTLEDVIRVSEAHTQDTISENLITVEAHTASWENYPKNWRVTYYTQNSPTKRKTVVWENGQYARVLTSVSPPIANNQKLIFLEKSLAIDSDVILEKANEYALGKGYKPENVKMTLEKSNEDSVSPSWICELYANKRRIMTLRFSAQTGEILSVK